MNTPQQYEQYQDSLLTYIEVKEVIKTAEDDGFLKGKKEIAAKLKAKGFSLKEISEITDLSSNELKNL